MKKNTIETIGRALFLPVIILLAPVLFASIIIFSLILSIRTWVDIMYDVLKYIVTGNKDDINIDVLN